MSESASPASLSTEDLLFEAMDRQALRFIDMLNDETKDESGAERYDIQLKMKLFQMGQDWLIRRKKLRPGQEGEGEGEGIRDMRSWIADPGTRSILEQAMFDAGFVKAPAKKNGRPTKAEAAARQRYKDYTAAEAVETGKNDDSGWAELIEGGGEE